MLPMLSFPFATYVWIHTSTFSNFPQIFMNAISSCRFLKLVNHPSLATNPVFFNFDAKSFAFALRGAPPTGKFSALHCRSHLINESLRIANSRSLARMPFPCKWLWKMFSLFIRIVDSVDGGILKVLTISFFFRTSFHGRDNLSLFGLFFRKW